MEEDFLSNKMGEETNKFLSKKDFELLKKKLDEDRKGIVNLNKNIQILASSLNNLIQKITHKEESKKETNKSNDNSNKLTEFLNSKPRKRKTGSINGEIAEISDDFTKFKKKGIRDLYILA